MPPQDPYWHPLSWVVLILNQFTSMKVIGNNVYFLGGTYSKNFPTTTMAPLTLVGDAEIFYARFDATTAALLTSTLITSNGYEGHILDQNTWESFDVVNDEAYFIMETTSTNYPITEGSRPAGQQCVLYPLECEHRRHPNFRGHWWKW
jgi:hypothetical protein